jgi:DNA-binding NarL/FixJ family response regulator
VERLITVAVLDSNAGTRQGLVRRLGWMPGLLVVGEGGEAEEAVRMVGERRPDVVVVDAPRLAADPATLLARLAEAAPGAAMVVLTAYLSEEARSDLARAGARALLLKEIDSGALAVAIERAAGRAAAGERRSQA